MSTNGFIIGLDKLPALPEVPKMTNVTESDYVKAVDALSASWSMPLQDLEQTLRVLDHYGRTVIGSPARELESRSVADDRADAARLFEMIRARAPVEVAERQAVEARQPVAAIWLTAFATMVLALVAFARDLLPDLLKWLGLP